MFDGRNSDDFATGGFHSASVLMLHSSPRESTIISLDVEGRWREFQWLEEGVSSEFLSLDMLLNGQLDETPVGQFQLLRCLQLAFPAGESVHFAGIISAGKLIVASETQLRCFDLTKSERYLSPFVLSFPAGSIVSLVESDAHNLLALSEDRRIWSVGEGEQRSWNLPEANWRSMAIDSSGVVFVGGNDERVICGRFEKGEMTQVGEWREFDVKRFLTVSAGKVKSLAVGSRLFVGNEEVGMEGIVNGREASSCIRRMGNVRKRSMIPMDSLCLLLLRNRMKRPI